MSSYLLFVRLRTSEDYDSSTTGTKLARYPTYTSTELSRDYGVHFLNRVPISVPTIVDVSIFYHPCPSYGESWLTEEFARHLSSAARLI